MSSLADLSAGYELVRKMRPIPVTKPSIGPLILAALLPLAVVAATQAPFKQLLDAIKGLLLAVGRPPGQPPLPSLRFLRA
jgi:hypothetical protein